MSAANDLTGRKPAKRYTRAKTPGRNTSKDPL